MNATYASETPTGLVIGGHRQAPPEPTVTVALTSRRCRVLMFDLDDVGEAYFKENSVYLELFLCFRSSLRLLMLSPIVVLPLQRTFLIRCIFTTCGPQCRAGKAFSSPYSSFCSTPISDTRKNEEYPFVRPHLTSSTLSAVTLTWTSFCTSC